MDFSLSVFRFVSFWEEGGKGKGTGGGTGNDSDAFLDLNYLIYGQHSIRGGGRGEKKSWRGGGGGEKTKRMRGSLAYLLAPCPPFDFSTRKREGGGGGGKREGSNQQKGRREGEEGSGRR